MSDIIPQKQCPKCKEWKPLTSEFFHVRSELKSGFASHCKPCRNDKQRRRPKVPEGQRRCFRCLKCLPATPEYFHHYKRDPSGLTNECKACRKKKHPVDLEHVGMKQCTRCHEWKPANLEYFYAEKLGKNGLMSRCRVCICKLTNTEERKPYLQQYRDEHSERNRVYFSVYNRTHRDERKALHHNYKARKRQNGGTHTAEDIRKQYERQKGRCYWCGSKIQNRNYHVDHIVPITRGGSNDISNLVVSCPHCNVTRCNKLPHEWPEGGRLL